MVQRRLVRATSDNPVVCGPDSERLAVGCGREVRRASRPSRSAGGFAALRPQPPRRKAIKAPVAPRGSSDRRPFRWMWTRLRRTGCRRDRSGETREPSPALSWVTGSLRSQCSFVRRDKSAITKIRGNTPAIPVARICRQSQLRVLPCTRLVSF